METILNGIRVWVLSLLSKKADKTDLEDDREVPREEATKFATDNHMYFIETSAKKQSRVDDAFEKLFELSIQLRKKRSILRNVRGLFNRNNLISEMILATSGSTSKEST